MTESTLQELIKCNAEAFNCVADLEAFGRLDEGAMLGLKNWLSEQKLLLDNEKVLDETLILSSEPIRTNLTDTECVMILSGSVAGLIKMTAAEDVRRAMLWLALDDLYWKKVSERILELREIKPRQEEGSAA